MSNEYRTWYADTEQDWVTSCAKFLENVVGWYHVDTPQDIATNKQVVWISEGEEKDNRTPRMVAFQGLSNNIYIDCPMVGVGGYDFTTDTFNIHLGTKSTAYHSPIGPIPGRCRTVANKDRIFLHTQPTTTVRSSSYAGFIESFYTALEDPFPALIRGGTSSTFDWTETVAGVLMFRQDESEEQFEFSWNNLATNEGYPNPRTGEYSFSNPVVYYDTVAQYSEVRGRIKGLYYGKSDRLANGSFVSINSDYYLITKTTNEVDCVAVGPVTSNGQLPPNHGWMPSPNLQTDYAYRGMEVDVATSGTLALWRFDTGHLDGYVYGQGTALPIPSTYLDEVSNYDLTAQGGVTSVESRLREAADFNGTSHYADSAGDATSASALTTEWTYECVFKPDTIPTASARATLIDYGTSGATAADNTLLRISISPAVGTTPDQYNVERGNIDIFWEEGTASAINNLTIGDFIQQNRWNYLAIVKKFNGANYDIDVWHCSFGDFVIPTKKATFTSVNNANSGTSSDWYIGASEDLANYFDGQVDETRITERVLTDDEILSSCSRSML